MKVKFVLMFWLIIAGAILKPTSAEASINLQFHSDPSLSLSPSSAQWGQNVTINLSVINLGTTASGTFQVNLYLENTDGSNSVLWANIDFPSLAQFYYAGGSPSITLPTYVPTGLTSGQLRVRAVISQNSVSSVVGTINITATNPDLKGYSFGVQQSSTTWGGLVSVQCQVTNFSSGDAGPFNVKVYISPTNDFSANNTNRYAIETIAVSSGLQGGYYENGSNYVRILTWNYHNIQLPATNPFAGNPSTIYVGMVVDDANQVTETNESNNYNQGAGIDLGLNPITVTAPQANLLVSPDADINFGNVAVDNVGGAVGTKTITVSNTGGLSLQINGISTSGAPFQIASIVSDIQNLSQPVTFPRSLSADSVESWVVTLTYDPTAIGSQTGSLTINSNDPNVPIKTLSLSGTGIPVAKLSLLDPVDPNNDLTADYGGWINDGAGASSTSKTFTLTNMGSGPLTISQNGISLTETANGVWSIVSITSNTQGTINLSSEAKTIAANGTETWSIVVKFDPIANTNYATGLQVSSIDPNSGATVPTITTCTLTGKGLIPATLNVTDSIGSASDHAMNFGSLHATGHQQATGTVTLVNTGQLPFVVAQNGIAIDNATNFQITSIVSSTQGEINLSAGTKTIAPSSSETWTVGVVFKPVASNSLTANLNIQSDDPNYGVVPVALSGNGLNQPCISVINSSDNPTGTDIPYGPVLNDGVGNRTATKTVTIKNIGLQPLVIPQNGLTISGSSTFSIQSIVSSTQGAINLSTGSATVAADEGETWTVTLVFDPVADTSYTATLSIQSNDPVHATVTQTLSGSGTTPTITLQPTSAGSTLYIPAGQPYNITWNAAYTAGNAQITLYLSISNSLPANVSNMTQIGSTTHTPDATTGSYAWRPDASLIGQEFYIYGTIADGMVSNGSFSAQKVRIESASAFNLLSPLTTTSTNYAYQYVYNGKVYAGTTTLQAGQNTITIITPGTGEVHKITVNKVDSLLATQGYTYDELNRIHTYTNGNGITTTYTYDLAGNLIQTSATNGNTVNYTYDVLKRKTSMVDSTGTTFYDYDDLDRIIAVTYSASGVKGGADNKQIQYQYNNASRLTKIIYPGGEEIQYTYDGAGRMLSANNVTKGQNTYYTYNSTTGQLTSVTRPNGIVTTYEYDTAGRLDKIKHVKSGSTLAEYAYTLDFFGNATALLTTFADASQKQELYTYDGLNRLTQVVYGSSATAGANDKTVSYTYDNVGNRLTQTTKINNQVTETLTYIYGSENRLLKVTDQNGNETASYVYDAAGNRIQKITPAGNTYYTYDERNMLTSVITPIDYTTYSYNGSAQRVSKTHNASTTNYIVDPNRSLFETVQEWNNGTVTKSYTYGLDRLIANPAIGDPQFYLPDRLGSVRLITDPSGTITESNNYDAFGVKLP